MLRDIKFRAERVPDHEIVYGYYVKIGATHYIFTADGEQHEIWRPSLEQLLGYDKDGNEKYEGDPLESDFEYNRMGIMEEITRSLEFDSCAVDSYGRKSIQNVIASERKRC